MHLVHCFRNAVKMLGMIRFTFPTSREFISVVFLSLSACASEKPVLRKFGAEATLGPYVTERAYHNFLAGSLAEESGHFLLAQEHYEKVLLEYPEDTFVKQKFENVRQKALLQK